MLKVRNIFLKALLINSIILGYSFLGDLSILANAAIDTSKPWHPLQQVSKASGFYVPFR